LKSFGRRLVGRIRRNLVVMVIVAVFT